MEQNNSGKTIMMPFLEKINRVEGFDPSPFAVDFTDLETGEVRKRLPVMIQIAWFRLKYPEGKIAVQTSFGNNCFIATAKIYPKYTDSVECYLAEATASRSSNPDRPSISPREWAQTAAIGIALRNAGFGLQFAMAGEASENEFIEDKIETEIFGTPESNQTKQATPEQELTPEEKLKQALKVPCPIGKFLGKSLGEVLTLEPGALKWIATKFTGDSAVKEAAQTICDYALQQTSA